MKVYWIGCMCSNLSKPIFLMADLCFSDRRLTTVAYLIGIFMSPCFVATGCNANMTHLRRYIFKYKDATITRTDRNLPQVCPLPWLLTSLMNMLCLEQSCDPQNLCASMQFHHHIFFISDLSFQMNPLFFTAADRARVSPSH
jgi:hypothetical protein